MTIRSLNNTQGLTSPDELQYLENKHLFGKSESQQLQTWNDEKNTYYGLVGISSIVSTLHMTREYQVNSMKHSDNWIESVTVV